MLFRSRAEKDDKSNVAKTWVKQVREEAYHVEDVIDKYLLHLQNNLTGEGNAYISSQRFFILP